MSSAAPFHVYRYRLRPMRPEQEALASQALGNNRWAYNRVVALNRDLERLGENPASKIEAINLLPSWKDEHDWLGLGPSQPLQQALIDYAQAQASYRQDPGNFKAPRFKRKHDLEASLRFPQPRQEDWNPGAGWINLPKLGQLRYFKDRRIPHGILKQVSLVREGPRWMVCLCVEQNKGAGAGKARKLHQLPEHPYDLAETDIFGVDLGHVHAATDHLGNHYDFPLKRVAELDAKIARLQAILAHKRTAAAAFRKHQKDQEKAQEKVRETKPSVTNPSVTMPEEAAASKPDDRPVDSRTLLRARAFLRKLQIQRKDLLADARHQLTHRLTERAPVLGVEDLALKRLLENEKRTTTSQATVAAQEAQPLTPVAARFKRETTSETTRPAKKFLPRVQEKSLHRGWACLGAGIILNQLAYKAARKGGVVVKVNPAYTSKTCPVCQHIDKSNRESQAVFRCKACGFQDHADRVGATNIRTRAMETLMIQGFPQPKTPRHRRPRNPKKRKVQTAQAA